MSLRIYKVFIGNSVPTTGQSCGGGGALPDDKSVCLVIKEQFQGREQANYKEKKDRISMDRV